VRKAVPTRWLAAAMLPSKPRRKGKPDIYAHPASGKNASTVKASEVIAGHKLYVRLGTGAAGSVHLATLPAQQQTLQQVFPINRHCSSCEPAHHDCRPRHEYGRQQAPAHLTITADQQSIDALATILPQSMTEQALAGIHLLGPLISIFSRRWYGAARASF